jgi:hypothetical protein
MEEKEVYKEKSAYNEALLQIARLDAFWVRAEIYANSGLFKKWQFIQDSIWRELKADVLRKQESKKLISKNIELKKKIADSKNRTEFYNALDERHQFLKHLQDLVGKGGSYIEQNEGTFE